MHSNTTYNASAKSHTHLQFTPTTATPKIAKEYGLPPLNPNRKELWIDNRTEKSQQRTLYKRNAGFPSNDEHLTSNKLYGKLEVCASKSCTTLILAAIPHQKQPSMKTHLKIMVMFLLLLSSCCKDGAEVNQYLLSDSERLAIPYLPNETVKFNHTNGFEFDMVVANRQTEWRITDTKHCGDDWSKYEALIVSLNSTSPELHIKIESTPKEIYRTTTISINKNTQFQLNLVREPTIDTLTLNGHTFANIYKADVNWIDTLVIAPKQILYSKEVGILQIIMSDNERFTINE